ncbi:MAG: hypothetical protein M0R00_09650, partial [Candidatus Omnitrophica bacterium]|nr:hypothetical protein [Candidatus Omnitrophota bacterium]
MKKTLNKKNLAGLAACAFIFLFSYIIRINPAIPFFLILTYFCFRKKFARVKNANPVNLTFLFLISFCLGY